VSVTKYAYDGAGNQTLIQDPVQSTDMTWNARAMLAIAEVPAGIVTFVYNADGRVLHCFAEWTSVDMTILRGVLDEGIEAVVFFAGAAAQGGGAACLIEDGQGIDELPDGDGGEEAAEERAASDDPDEISDGGSHRDAYGAACPDFGVHIGHHFRVQLVEFVPEGRVPAGGDRSGVEDGS
jgi:hypothetical protein